MTADSLRRLFRGLLIGQLVLTIVAGTVQEFDKRSLPEPLRSYVTSRPDPGAWELALGGVLIVLTIVLTVGMYRFWRPARALYVGLYPVALVGAVFLPPVVQSSLASALYSFGATIAGLIIGLAFFSPVASEFEMRARRRTSAVENGPRPYS